MHTVKHMGGELDESRFRNIMTGSPSRVFTKLSRRVKIIADENKFFKIGVTSDTANRARQGYKNGILYPIYSSSTPENPKKIEKSLITYSKANHSKKNCNKSLGGNGNFRDGTNFVYVIADKSPIRLTEGSTRTRTSTGRKCPKSPAKSHNLGTKRKGIDNKRWIVKWGGKAKNGKKFKKWVRC